jgi:hypothetical protein
MPCPFCGAIAADMVWFTWGFCEFYDPRPGETYRVGDRLKWKALEDGTVPAWTWFLSRRTGYGLGGNVGDPSVRHLVARDDVQFVDEGEPYERRCPQCGRHLPGAAVEIRQDVIVRAWLLTPGELAGARTYVFEPTGLRAIKEWDDHPMGVMTI